MSGRLNGAASALTSTEGPGPSHPSTACSGPAYNSILGNARDDNYPTTSDRLLGEVILYGTGHSLASQLALEAYQLRFWGL